MTPKWLQSILTATQLKALPRSGWVRNGVSQPETVAAHSWGVAFLVLNTLPSHLNLEKALSYAILHDLAESITGDFTPFDQISKSEKSDKETRAMLRICGGLEQGQQIMRSWLDYEEQRTPEAQFVRELDRLDMAIQALHYAFKNVSSPLDEFFDSAEQCIKDPILKPLMKQIRAEYNQLTAKQATR